MSSPSRRRLRDLGVTPGIMRPGPTNSIVDVSGVLVGHTTLKVGSAIRTGVTAVLPQPSDLFKWRVPAGLAVGNGFGKLLGATQVAELGELETPIVLTNTLAVPRAADALLDWTLSQATNLRVNSVNPFVGETNDGYLNDIRARVIQTDHVSMALHSASAAPPEQGAVGAGTGTVAFGFKGGIGSASRRLPEQLGGFTLGVLVQSNYGGVLQVAGRPVGERSGRYYLSEEVASAGAETGSAARGTESGASEGPGRLETPSAAPPPEGGVDGSIMIVVATDAPLSDRNLRRLAARALAGLARTGAAMSNGSGDYALAFSCAESVRRRAHGEGAAEANRALAARSGRVGEVDNERMSPLFLAAIEATEEAIYDSLCLATTVEGQLGRVVKALPYDLILAGSDRGTTRD